MRYVKDSIIAHGGMGDVYSGHADNGMKVALKQVSASVASNPMMLDLFEKEAFALMKLNSPGIVHILEKPFADYSGNLYLPMEFVEGETLSQVVKRSGPMSEERAKMVMLKILNAMDHVHSHNLVHRDIKPSNIMLRPDDSICIIDFGIAKDTHINSGIGAGEVLGTDGYMSPEQAAGLYVDYRTDVYSLGCVLFFLVTGTHPFDASADPARIRQAILSDAFPRPKDRLSTVSDYMQSVILTAVDKNMLQRFQSISKFRNALLGVSPTTIAYPNEPAVRGALVTVGRSGTDIVFSNSYVSTYHLDIEYIDGVITITDHSTNGTGVMGKRLFKGDVFSFKYTLGSKQVLPPIYLAGRADCEVPWKRVLKLIKERIDK